MSMFNPVMTVFAGVNGAGKSSLTRMLDGEFEGVIINPDSISRDFSLGAVSSGRRVISMVKACITTRESFSLETTFSGKLIVNQIRSAKETGFMVVLHYVWLSSLEEHIARVSQRVKLGGHDIPREDIIRRYGSSQEQLVDNVTLYDNLLIWDNSNGKPELCSFSTPTSFELFIDNPLSSVIQSKVRSTLNLSPSNSFINKSENNGKTEL